MIETSRSGAVWTFVLLVGTVVCLMSSRSQADKGVVTRSSGMKILVVLNGNPYDGTDVAWNALRLVGKMADAKTDVRLFLMNDSVDLARESTKPPEGYFDLVAMVKELVKRNVPIKACGTCQARCGIHKNEPYYEGPRKATMDELAAWVQECDKVLVF
jgi:uncharacterized protein involved in oxidation of intracellular sulfur